MIDYSVRIPYKSIDELQQNNGLISSLVYKPKEVGISSQVFLFYTNISFNISSEHLYFIEAKGL